MNLNREQLLAEAEEEERGSRHLAACIFIAALLGIAALAILYILSVIQEINNENITPMPKVLEIHVQDRLLLDMRPATT